MDGATITVVKMAALIVIPIQAVIINALIVKTAKDAGVNKMALIAIDKLDTNLDCYILRFL